MHLCKLFRLTTKSADVSHGTHQWGEFWINMKSWKNWKISLYGLSISETNSSKIYQVPPKLKRKWFDIRKNFNVSPSSLISNSLWHSLKIWKTENFYKKIIAQVMCVMLSFGYCSKSFLLIQYAYSDRSFDCILHTCFVDTKLFPRSSADTSLNLQIWD